MQRLFVAVDLSEEVKGELVQLWSGLPGTRWVTREQLHLTLRFIGDVEAQLQGKIDAALRQVGGEPFSMVLRQVGHFGRPARVLWVGMENVPELLVLQQRVETALVRLAIAPEERPFSPHITLARLKGTPPSLLASYEGQHRSFAATPFTVTEFHLYSSTLSSSGAIHRREGTYPLRGR
jgi:RNA 2',3'-cyclic 3'-phosphodiesterase